jgi:hypothetical protein
MIDDPFGSGPTARLWATGSAGVPPRHDSGDDLIASIMETVGRPEVTRTPPQLRDRTRPPPSVGPLKLSALRSDMRGGQETFGRSCGGVRRPAPNLADSRP